MSTRAIFHFDPRGFDAILHEEMLVDPAQDPSTLVVQVEARSRGGGPLPSWFIDRECVVWLRCVCGAILGTPTNHAIHNDGTIVPSIPHSQSSGARSPCGWHPISGKLVGWSGKMMHRGERKVLL